MKPFIVILSLMLTTGCATLPGQPPHTVDLSDQAQMSEFDGVVIRAQVLRDEQAHELFGVRLGVHGIQAVWLQIQNDTDGMLHYLPVTTDSDYFSPLEVAWKTRSRFRDGFNEALRRQLFVAAMPSELPAGETTQGFVFTNRDLGVKIVNVDVVGGGQHWQTSFLVEVPGIKLDVEKVNFDQLYELTDLADLDDQGLNEFIASQPCCTRNQSGEKTGDPVNFVLVGDAEVLLNGFAVRGWDLTERIHGGSIWKTMQSFLLGSSYRYSPVSSLYFFDRPQDIALQNARGNIHQRNHLRLWRAPVTYHGRSVWMGQISRDIGVRLTRHSPTLTTHKIDPDVDETRDYLLQDLMLSQHLARFGYVRSMLERGIGGPGHNLTGDPYITDGLRLVMFMDASYTTIDAVQVIGDEVPSRDRRARLTP